LVNFATGIPVHINISILRRISAIFIENWLFFDPILTFCHKFEPNMCRFFHLTAKLVTLVSQCPSVVYSPIGLILVLNEPQRIILPETLKIIFVSLFLVTQLYIKVVRTLFINIFYFFFNFWVQRGVNVHAIYAILFGKFDMCGNFGGNYFSLRFI
jgi:hypothetical protein